MSCFQGPVQPRKLEEISPLFFHFDLFYFANLHDLKKQLCAARLLRSTNNVNESLTQETV